MARHGIRLTELRKEQVESFLLTYLDRPLGKQSKHCYRSLLRRYLDHLHQRRLLSFDPTCLRVGSRRSLPPMAEQFLQTLEPTRRPGTVVGYRSSLGELHEWLRRQGLSLEQLERKHMCLFLSHLHRKGLAASTRVGLIVQLRAYLRWLDEEGQLAHAASELIQSTDLPKRPSYLPRPLPPEADQELMRRLSEGESRYRQGLLLMRRTGIRIGELLSLPLHCLRHDLKGNQFLKVPLGKLHNERLVPLDEQTVQLVLKLQEAGNAERSFLLEKPSGGRMWADRYRKELRDASEGLSTDGAVTPHRLRHSYATSLLSGGMSLPCVMKLLGHRDYRMTLRYTAVTQETVGREYREALVQLQSRYEELSRRAAPQPHDPLCVLGEMIRWIKSHIGQELGHKRKASALVKRLERIQSSLEKLLSQDADK